MEVTLEVMNDDNVDKEASKSNGEIFLHFFLPRTFFIRPSACLPVYLLEALLLCVFFGLKHDNDMLYFLATTTMPLHAQEAAYME